MPADSLAAPARLTSARGASSTIRSAGQRQRCLPRQPDAAVEFDQECQRLAVTGFDDGFEPVMFDSALDTSFSGPWRPGSVTYDGRTHAPTTWCSPQPGARFLLGAAIRSSPRGGARSHTALHRDVHVYPSGTLGPVEAALVHLRVVRDEIILIDTPESLITVAGEAPPSRAAFDVRAMMRCCVCTRQRPGGVGRRRRERMPKRARFQSDAERREVRDTGQRRDAARKAVDWKRRNKMQPPADDDGCRCGGDGVGLCPGVTGAPRRFPRRDGGGQPQWFRTRPFQLSSSVRPLHSSW